MSADGQRAFRGLCASSQAWLHRTRVAATGHQYTPCVRRMAERFSRSRGRPTSATVPEHGVGGVVMVKTHGLAVGALFMSYGPDWWWQPHRSARPATNGDQSAARGRTEPRRKRLRVRARAVALLALTLMAMPAVGDVIWPDIDVIGRNDFFDYRHHRPTDYIYRDDSRIDEVFPIKHRCSEVRVLIHAQRRTVERMIESCKALKWADDRFHALMQTNPGDALAEPKVYGTHCGCGAARTPMVLTHLGWRQFVLRR